MIARFFIGILLLSIQARSQEIISDTLYSFRIENKELIWQKVYETKYENDGLVTAFKTSVISNMKKDNLQEVGNRITFEVNGDQVDFKKYGGKWGNTGIFVQYPINYLVQIDFKENRYRVTIKDIVVDFTAARLGTNELTEIVCRKQNTEFAKSKTVINGMVYYDKHLDNYFQFEKIIDENDDW